MAGFRLRRVVRGAGAVAALLALLVLAAPTAAAPPGPKVLQLLKQKPLADSFYACLLNGLSQGLPLSQIRDECETKLVFEGKGGIRQTPPAPDPSRPGSGKAWDPAALQADCSAGDPTRAQGTSGSPLRDGWIPRKTDWGTVDYEHYTYGGKGQKGGYVTDEHGQVGVSEYKGLTKAEAEREKKEAINEYERAKKEYVEVVKKQTAALAPAQKKLNDAADKKDKDPNQKPAGGITRPSTSSECETLLQQAREIVAECQRTGWRSSDCQQLQARLNHCPDPTLIYVDPEGGYACRPAIDQKAVRDAWVDRCHELKRPAPGGPDPCVPPKVDANVRFIVGQRSQVCGGPQVLVTPDNQSPECVQQINLPKTEKTIHELYVWALNKFGGPIVVFGPRPGTSPEPKPKPQ